MTLIGEQFSSGQAAPAGDLIKEGSDAGFMADVIEASRQQPVIVDFWATWCGPCRQLTPTLEKVVLSMKGAVKLVKIDVDKNPAYAGQLRVQSIPTVYAFVNGQPVDGFQGALPESQVRQFIERLAGPPAPEAIDEILALAKESMDLGDIGGAAQAYAQALQMDQTNVKALGGLARCYIAGGDTERAAELVAMAPADAKDPDLDAARASLALAEGATSETAPLEQALAADPDDHQARFDLAGAYAGQGRYDLAADQLLELIARDRTWNEEAARKQLLVVFEAAGLTSEVTRQGRRRLSSILFS
ncbi:MAG: thioredoxin [Caulobacter sp.]|jgi:putative thioredoxin